MSSRRSVALIGLLAIAFWRLPSAEGPLETVVSYSKILLHLLGISAKPREAHYDRKGKVRTRQVNGSLPEVQGFVNSDTFRAAYLHRYPVVFRDGVSRSFGFDFECLQPDTWSLKDMFESALRDEDFWIVKDPDGEAPAEPMTLQEYKQLAYVAKENDKGPVPVAQAFPQNKIEKCTPVPTQVLNAYHGVSGTFSQWLSPEADTSYVSVSYHAEGTGTKMHMDLGDRLYVQVYGRKNWTFVHRKYAPQMKIHGDHLNAAYVAGFNVHRERVPREVDLRQTTLNPGDILYIPPMTFYASYDLDEMTIGVENLALDPVAAFLQHWLLASTTLLNPRAFVEVARMWSDKGISSFSDLIFHRFRKNRRDEL